MIFLCCLIRVPLEVDYSSEPWYTKCPSYFYKRSFSFPELNHRNLLIKSWCLFCSVLGEPQIFLCPLVWIWLYLVWPAPRILSAESSPTPLFLLLGQGHPSPPLLSANSKHTTITISLWNCDFSDWVVGTRKMTPTFVPGWGGEGSSGRLLRMQSGLVYECVPGY